MNRVSVAFVITASFLNYFLDFSMFLKKSKNYYSQVKIKYIDWNRKRPDYAYYQ